MAARGGSKTPGPGKALQNILNTGTPLAATGKRSKNEDRTVDVGALLRGKLQGSVLVPKLHIPKLRGQQENQQAGAAQENAPNQAPVLQCTNPMYSPDDSLQRVASRLAKLRGCQQEEQQQLLAPSPKAQAKASRMGAPAAAAAPHSKLALSSGLGLRPAAPPAPATGEPRSAAAAREALPSQASRPPRPEVHPAAPAANPPAAPSQRGAGIGSPEHCPVAEAGSGDEGEVPLAARTAISKRHRRKSQHHGPERFGDWWAGDDDSLEKTLEEYNLTQHQQAAEAVQEPRMTRAQRRKSLAPPAVRSLAAEGGGLAAALQQESSEEKLGAASEDVAARVDAITLQLCDRLDTLIEPSPREKGRKRKNEDERSLHEKLVEAWEGKSYYERLKEMADKEEQAVQQQAEQQQQQPAEPAAGGGRPPKLNLAALGPVVTASPSSRTTAAKTPRRARQAQQLRELTESLKHLQVSGANRTSKAAAALASKVRSMPNSRCGSPRVPAAVAAQPTAASTQGGPDKPGPARAAAAATSLDSGPTKAQDATGKAAAAVPSPRSEVVQASAARAAAPATSPTMPAGARAAEAARRPVASRLASPAAPQQQRQEAPQPSMRVTRAKSRSPEPATKAEALPKQRAPHKPASSPLGLVGRAAAGASPPCNPAAPAGHGSEGQLQAELEAAYQMLNAALEDRKAADEQAKELQAQLIAEKQARKAAQKQSDELAAELKEEVKMRQAAERRSKELDGQVEELQRRAEHAEALERTLGRVAEKAAESGARHAAAEAQVAAILKAANTLVQQLGQGAAEAHALQDLAAARGVAENAPHTGGVADNAPHTGGSSGRANRQQPAKLWR